MGLFDNAFNNLGDLGGSAWEGFTDLTGLDNIINDIINDIDTGMRGESFALMK